MEQPVTKIIEDVRDEMCKHYCKYTDKSMECLEQDEVYEICADCPLNRL